MAALTETDVQELAALAKLSLSSSEAEQLVVELSSILDHMQALADVDTDGVEPMTHAVPMDLPLRTDAVQPSFEPGVATDAAPAASDHCFSVPTVIKQRT